MNKVSVKNVVMSAISSVVLVLFVLFAYSIRIEPTTDIIILSQYIFDGMSSWYVVLLTLVAEMFILKFFLKETYSKATAVTLFMNMVSTVLGIVVLHIVALIVEVLFLPVDVGSFHVSHWVVNLIAVIPVYAAIEGLAIKIGFKYKFRKVFPKLCIANAACVVICFLCNLSWISEMFF